MRIATNTLYSISTMSLQKHSTDQARLQEQMASGRKVLTPSDDPIASGRILDINQAASIANQYAVNSKTADSALGITEATISQVVSVIQDMLTLAVNAGNATQTAAEKKILDNELQGRYQELMGLANSSDSNGVYLFSGFQGSVKPFSEITMGNVDYNGDDGVRKVQISSGRQIPISESGNDVFRNIKNGNGTFVTAAASTNTGSGVISSGDVTSTTNWKSTTNPRDFQVVFSVSGGTTTYSVLDSSGASLGYNNLAYTEGGAISLPDYGVQFSITGTPADGDTFTLNPSTNQDVFKTLGNFSTALSNYTTDSTGAGQASFQNQLNSVMLGLDNALSQVLKIQASIGARMNESESVQSTNEDLQLQYATTLSGLQDLDYAAAISEFSINQMLLEATRSSFAKVQDLSLFKYI